MSLNSTPKEMKKILNIHKTALWLLGINFSGNGSSMNIANKAWIIFLTLNIICFGVQSIIDILLKTKFSIADVSSNIFNTSLYVGCLVRLLYYNLHSGQVSYILATIEKSFRLETGRIMNDFNVKYHNKLLLIYDILWRTNSFLAVEMIVLVPLLASNKRSLPLPIWCPWNWEDNTIAFVNTILLEAFENFILGLVYTTTDLFFFFAAILTSFQFRLLGEDFKDALYTAMLEFGLDIKEVIKFSKHFNRNGSTLIIDDQINYNAILSAIKTKSFEDKLDEVLKNLIKKHQDLLEFSKYMENFFSPILLPVLTTLSFYIIFMAYCAVTVSESNQILPVLEYLVSVIVQLLMLAFAGQIFTAGSEAMRENVYNMPWYLIGEKQKKTMLIILMGMRKPVVFTVGKYVDISLNMFLMVMKMSYSFFTVLRKTAVKK